MSPVSVFVFIGLALVLCYGIGLVNFLNDFGEDKCEMTYMFEYPQYIRISNKADEVFPKYGLYAYSEGGLTSRARSMFFDGIPVLFIPGNAGSYKQVRSLSSVALRKALNSRTPFHFDYFTIDFNDELSGLYGPLLYDQLDYVNRSLYSIFELYQERKNKPTSVILIGHSMGGVIARNLLSVIPDPNLISTLIALAAPLRRPPLVLDYHMDTFQKESAWKVPQIANTTVISLSGGYTDFLMPTYLTNFQGKNSLSVVTTNIPRCWIESNHIQIIWCKQVVLAINRALFDSVDWKTKQISSNSTHRRIAFNHYFIHDSGIKVQNDENNFKVIKIDHRGQWIESLLRQYSLQFLKGVKEPHWYMVKFTNLPAHEKLSVLAINLEVVDWIFACNANFPRGSSRICIEAVPLTQLSEIWPSRRFKRRYFEVNMHELWKNNSDLTHIAFKALPTSEPVVFHVDVYNSADRKMIVNLPKWWSLKREVILEETPVHAVQYELVIRELEHITQYYQLFLEPLDCATSVHHASASLIVPWSNQNHHTFFTNTETTPLKLRLYSSKPSQWSNQSAVIKLTLEPSCTYRISLKPSIVGMFGQIVRFYTPLLLTNIAAVVLMSLKYQLKNLKNGYCSIIFISVKEGAKPYYILTFVKILSKLFSEMKLPGSLSPDGSYIVEDGIDFFLLPFLLYMCSVGIVWLLGVIFSILLITLESVAHKLALKFLARIVSLNIVGSDYLMSALHKVPFFVAGTLIFICFTTCGGLALCLGTIFYFLKLTQMSQDYVEEVIWFIMKRLIKRCKLMLSKRNDSNDEVDEHHYVENKEMVEPVKTLTNAEDNEKDSTTDDGDKQADKVPSDSKIQGNITIDNMDNLTNRSNKVRERRKKMNKRNKVEVAKNSQLLDKVNKENMDSKPHDPDKNKPETGKKELSSAYNSIFFHLTMFFVWCIVTIINIPAVLTWAHNFRFSTYLSPDDSFIPGLALSICALPLWHFDVPKTYRKWTNEVGVFVWAVAVVSLVFASVSVYRLNYLLSFTIVVIILHQTFAPKSNSYIEQIDHDVNDKTRDKYDDVKSKLD